MLNKYTCEQNFEFSLLSIAFIHAIYFFLFVDMISCSPGWPLINYLCKEDFELLILLPLILECLDYR